MNGKIDTKHRLGELFWLVILLLPNLVNDLFLLGVGDLVYWLGVDYTTRLITFSLVLTVPIFRQISVSSLTMHGSNRNWWLGAVFVAAIALLFDYTISHWLYIYFGAKDAVMFSFPQVHLPWLKMFDLTIGIAIVAISEEIVCRGIFKHIFEKYVPNQMVVAIASSMVFSAFHWSHGPAAMLSTFFIGTLLMALYQKTKSLWPPIVAHYIINFIYFF
ncbi:MAG: CPBP family intramembrane metalloprotease [Rhodospirillaceae bacterium]|nr:CPBP family intramembrane metalloprotease [Rhodospirillaceae bacterium]